PPSRSDPADSPHGAASADGAMAITLRASDRTSHEGSRGGGAAHGLAPVRGEAGRLPAPARRDLGDGGLRGTIRSGVVPAVEPGPIRRRRSMGHRAWVPALRRDDLAERRWNTM